MIRAGKWLGLMLAGLVGAGACFSGAVITGTMQEETAYAAGDVAIDATNFPDENFRKIVAEEFDSDNDGSLSDAEIEAATYLYCSNKSIKDMTGIEKLIGLYSLSCDSNSINTLDISKNTELESLSCSNNNLQSLDLSKNRKLKRLSCNSNNLKTLELSNNTKLETLDCYENKLEELNLSNNTELESLWCSWNNIEELDLNKNSKLITLYCSSNNLTVLKTVGAVSIRELLCQENFLNSLDVSNNTALTQLNCSENKLTDIDVSNNVDLKNLYCYQNNLKKLDISNNHNLTTINCSDNKVNEIIVRGAINLQELDCYDNDIESLDLKKNENLKELNCANNRLSEIDVSGNSNLRILVCYSNSLTSLDLKSNTRINQVSCFGQERDVKNVNNEILFSSFDTKLDHDRISNVNGAELSEKAFIKLQQDYIRYGYDIGFGDNTMSVRLNVSKIDVNNISLDATNIMFEEGNTYQLIATVSPEDASIKNVIWSSDDTTVATVDENGKISAIAPGVAMISAETEDGGYRADCLVTVNKKIINAESVALDKKLLVLDKGNSQPLTASVKPDEATDKTVTWSSSDENVATVDNTGNVTAVNHGKAVITAKTANGKTATCEIRVNFADVASESLYYYKPVYWAAENGITTGANGLFAPHNKCTREHAITFLWCMAGSPAPKSMTSKFKDITNKNSYSYKAIMWGTENGVITGANGVFAPSNTCTREQIVTMLWRLAGKPEPKNSVSKFKDVQNKNSYSYKAILWAAEKGITTGANGNFAPGKVCTRAEIVTFIYRYRNMK